MTATIEQAHGQPAVARLKPEVCAQMAKAFPLGANAKIVKQFDKPESADGAYAHAVMADGARQILVMVGEHPYTVMSDDTRRRASRAVKETELANLGMSPLGGVFALLDGQVVTDPAVLNQRQDECVFGRAFALTSPLA
jgi:hypothetical protein